LRNQQALPMPSQTQNWYYNTDPTAIVTAFSVAGIVLAPITLMIGVFYLSYRASKFSWNRIVNPCLGVPYMKPVPCLPKNTANGFDSYQEAYERLAYKTLAK